MAFNFRETVQIKESSSSYLDILVKNDSKISYSVGGGQGMQFRGKCLVRRSFSDF